MKTSPKSEILPLTSLRFAAALYVFLFHINMRWPLAERGSWEAQLLSQGAVGMSLFFVLSGFVLGYRYSDGIGDLKRFSYDRVTRIYPVYLLAAVVTLPWFISNISNLPSSAARKAAQSTFILFADIFMVQAWFPQLFAFGNNSGSWSLSAEAFFYATLPLVLIFLLRYSNRHIAAWSFLFYLMAALAGLSWVLFPKVDFHTFYSIPIYRLGEFLIGVSAGILFARGVRLPLPAVAFWLTGALLTAYLAIGPDFGFTFVTHNFVVVPLILVLLYSAASIDRASSSFAILSSPPLIYAGRISYSFYSFQAFVLFFLIDLAPSVAWMSALLDHPQLLALVAFFVLTVIAATSYELIEVRFRAKLRSVRSSRLTTEPAL